MKRMSVWLFVLCLVLISCNSSENKTDEEIKAIDMSSYKDLCTQILTAKTIADYNVRDSIDDCDTVTFGKYEIDGNIKNGLEDIEWVVVDRNDSSAILLSKNILDCKSYIDIVYYAKKNIDDFKDINNSRDFNDAVEEYGSEKMHDSFKNYYEPLDKISWNKCSLREWLNDEFYDTAFSIEQKQYLNEYDVSDGNDNFENKYDNCFCLSLDEMKKYFKFNSKNINTLSYANPTVFAQLNANFYNGIEIRKNAPYTGFSDYWFRTSLGNKQPDQYVYTSLPQINREYSAFGFFVGRSASHERIVDYVNSQEKNIGVRPAICVNLKMDEVKNKIEKLSLDDEESIVNNAINFNESMYLRTYEIYNSDDKSTSAFGKDNDDIISSSNKNYYDPFADFDDIFENFGKFGW